MATPLIRYKDRTETSLIIIHDSHTLPEVCKMEDVPRWADLAFVNGLKMGLLSIGYHAIIERDGTIVECNEYGKVGAHTPGFNMESIGICLVGGREEVDGDGVDNFTPEQRAALLILLKDLKAKYPEARIKGHSEVQKYHRRGHPPCPPIDMDLLREDVELFAKGIVL